MDIKYNILEKQLNSNQELNSMYLLYGDEKYLIENIVKKIKNKFGELVLGINYIVVDETNLKNLITNIEMPAFGYDKKLIIVKNSGLFKKDGRKKEATSIQKEIGNYIQENYSIIEELSTILFIEDIVEKNFVFEVLNKNAVICEIMELNPVELITKLKKICSLYKVQVDDKVLSYLIEVSGTNLQILINEIRKLIEHAGEGNRIVKEDVDQLSIKQIEGVIFDLTDNLASKNISKAIDILDNLIYQKEPLQKILITLYNHFKKLYICKIAILSNKDILLSLNLKPNQTFLINKYKKQAQYFEKEDLRNIINELVDIDYKSKIGLVDINIAMRGALCKYCS